MVFMWQNYFPYDAANPVNLTKQQLRDSDSVSWTTSVIVAFDVDNIYIKQGSCSEF